jgi:hypothetical protein
LALCGGLYGRAGFLIGDERQDTGPNDNQGHSRNDKPAAETKTHERSSVNVWDARLFSSLFETVFNSPGWSFFFETLEKLETGKSETLSVTKIGRLERRL